MKKFDKVQKAIIIVTSILMLILAAIIISIIYANMDKDLNRELSKLPTQLVETFDGEITIVDYVGENIDGQYFLKSHKIEILSNCHALAHELMHSYYNNVMNDAQRNEWNNIYNGKGCTSYANTNAQEALCECARLYTNSNPFLKAYLYIFYHAQYDFIANLF